MTSGSGRLVIRCVIAILTTAISIGTEWDGAIAQSRIGQIGRDGLTNRHEAPLMETEPCFGLICDRLSVFLGPRSARKANVQPAASPRTRCAVKSHRSVTPVTSFSRAVVNLAAKGS